MIRFNAFGDDQQAARNWFNTYEPTEQRIETFDGLDYVASYGDLINAFGTNGRRRFWRQSRRHADRGGLGRSSEQTGRRRQHRGNAEPG